MTLKEHLEANLKTYDIRKVDVVRGQDVKGVPSTLVEVLWVDASGVKTAGEFTFAVANKMTTEDMGYVIASYMRNWK